MGKHKKKLKEDKAKVKLKQSKTKFLPKGLNVTKTDFKIKPIVLVQQLKEKDASTPLSKRKLDVKDLLNRIKHYNENVRYGACEELAEMMKIHSDELINMYLSQIITSVSTLMQDRERKVRKSAAKVINTILEIVPDFKVEAFFNHFSTNIRCAMTNIDKNIQEDSLLFLDCFIKYNSGLIFKTSEKLLPAFFTLISKLRSDSTLMRTLTVNLGSKMTSVTWRLKVLSRLHAVLETIIRNHNLEDIERSDVYIDAESCNYIPLYKESFSTTLDNNVLDFANNKSLEGDALNRHIITLVPLLYEIWMEVVPEKNIGKGVSENTILKDEAAAILSCITKTLYLLWKYVKRIENDHINIKTVFLSNDGKKFIHHLLTNFPYSQVSSRSKEIKANNTLMLLEINTDPKCVAENLLICYMYCVLNLNHTPIKMKIELEAITAYISKCLLTRKYVDQKSVKYLIVFLKACLVEDPKSWKRAGADLKIILENTVTFYNFNTVSEKCKLEVFQILSDVVDVPFLKSSQHYHCWFSTLPNLLCEPKITDVLVNALLNLSRKNIEVFYKALQKKLSSILENLDALKIVLTSNSNSLVNNEETVKRNIVNIFFFVPHLDVKLISNYILTNPDSKYSYYFKIMLSLRTNNL
ncbi:testis-expressed protein 10 homolog [Anoplophora glabripennis]|nr:testis-expressed protein 10 homolog [Anoplophora glabripennis]